MVWSAPFLVVACTEYDCSQFQNLRTPLWLSRPVTVLVQDGFSRDTAQNQPICAKQPVAWVLILNHRQIGGYTVLILTGITIQYIFLSFFLNQNPKTCMKRFKNGRAHKTVPTKTVIWLMSQRSAVLDCSTFLATVLETVN